MLGLAWLLASVQGCGKEDNAGPQEPLKAVGEVCGVGDRCEGNTGCLEIVTPEYHGRVCGKECESDQDCDLGVKQEPGVPAFVCSERYTGAHICVEGCLGKYDVNAKLACVNGHPTACSVLDATFCEQCGCPQATRCEVQVGCQSQHDVGEPCLQDDECKTANCDNERGVCRVAVGAACTRDNCQVCLTAGNWSSCSRTCTDRSQCNGGMCHLRLPFGNQEKLCSPLCRNESDTTSCGGKCVKDDYDVPPVFICDCVDRCSIEPFERSTGEPCNDSTQCGGGDSCVDVPCAPDETVTCGKLCERPCNADEPRCSFGICRSLTSAESKPVDVCDPKLPNGAACVTPADCHSLQCADGACAP